MTLSRLFLTWFSQLRCNIYCYISMSHDIIYVKQYITYILCQRWYHIKCHIFHQYIFIQNELYFRSSFLECIWKSYISICQRKWFVHESVNSILLKALYFVFLYKKSFFFTYLISSFNSNFDHFSPIMNHFDQFIQLFLTILTLLTNFYE